ncbi:MAG: hypothetical protein ACTHPD_09045, partial [Rhizomicrobium sp.]
MSEGYGGVNGNHLKIQAFSGVPLTLLGRAWAPFRAAFTPSAVMLALASTDIGGAMEHDPALEAHEHAEGAEHAAHARDPY